MQNGREIWIAHLPCLWISLLDSEEITGLEVLVWLVIRDLLLGSKSPVLIEALLEVYFLIGLLYWQILGCFFPDIFLTMPKERD